MKANRLNWGLIFIIIGLVILGWSTGRLPFEVLIKLVEFFPILLIAFGIQMIFSRTKISGFAYLSSLLIILTAVYVVTPYWDDIGNPHQERTSGKIEQVADSGITALQIRADFADRDFTLDDFQIRGTQLNYDQELINPEVSFTVRNDVGVIKINQQGGGWRRIFGRSELPRWKLNVSQDLPLDLILTSKKGYCYLRMADLLVNSLDLECEKCFEVVLQFGDIIPDTPVKLDLRKSKLRIEIPREHNIRIRDGVSMPYYLTDELGFIEIGEDLIADTSGTFTQELILDLEPGLKELEINRR